MTEASEPVKRYASLGETEKLAPLAFAIRDDTPAYDHASTSVGWTSEGFEALKLLQKALGGPDKQRNLPYLSLIALLEMYVPRITRLDGDAGLRWKPPDKEVVHFAWTDASPEEARKGVETALREWVSEHIVPRIEKDTGAREALEWVKDRFDTGKLFAAERERRRLYPWTRVGNGTTKPTDREGYTALADFLARTLEGQAVFEGLPPLRRVVGRRNFETGNQAELLTEPIVEGAGEPFSLRLTVKVVSIPGVQQPLVLLDVGKRRWVKRLKPEPFGRSTISGYAFPADSSLSVRFSLEVKNGKYELSISKLTMNLHRPEQA